MTATKSPTAGTLRAILSEIDWDKMEEEQPQDEAQLEQDFVLMKAAASPNQAHGFVDVMAGSLLSEEEKSALLRPSEATATQSKRSMPPAS